MLKSSTSSVRSLNTLTWAIIGAEEALQIVTSVSRASGPTPRGVPSGLNVASKYGTRSVAAGRWSMVHVMALALPAMAKSAAIARHVIRVFFIEISSSHLDTEKRHLERPLLAIPSPPVIQFFPPKGLGVLFKFGTCSVPVVRASSALDLRLSRQKTGKYALRSSFGHKALLAARVTAPD